MAAVIVMISEPPRVSVVIPAYNRAGEIARAIESVQAQTMTHWEILVVDDASTDRTCEIVSQIAEPRLRLLRRERNGGAGAARNTGVRSARGEFIAFLDSDDAWLPEKLERQCTGMYTAGAPPAGCTGAVVHLLDHGETRIKPLVETSDWKRALLMDCTVSPGSTQMARRGLFEEIGPLDETLPRFEDWDWLARYGRRYGLHVTPEPLAIVYNRRARLGSVVERSAELFLAKHKDDIAGLSAADRAQMLADIWMQSTVTYAFEGKFASMARPAARALAARPAHTAWRLANHALRYVRAKTGAPSAQSNRQRR